MESENFRIATLAEGRTRLSIDFSDRDDEIQSRMNAIIGYLVFATGIKEAEYENLDDEIKALAKEYVLSCLFYDYYDLHTELNDRRLTAIIKQLQCLAMVS